VRETRPAPLIVMACAFILGSALCARGARQLAALRRRRACPDAASRWAAAPSTTCAPGRTPYLLGIAGIIIAGQIIGGFMYNEQGKSWRGVLELGDRAALFARMEICVNVLSLFFQAVVVAWLTRRGSVR
jgi:hypothetical protein